MKKCQHCEKPATFHITELTEPNGPVKHHLCEACAKLYLSPDNEDDDSPPNALVSMLDKQIKIDQTKDELEELDRKSCPICGITFAEFRKEGRLGCSYDYVCFEEDLAPLLNSIHGSIAHAGKRPTRDTGSPDRQHELIQLRREMQDAVQTEDYEKAGELRDRIKQIEGADGGAES